MIRLSFRVTFLSDVVLNAQTATQGEQRTLDYIPGSNFLGIAASKLYKESSELNFSRFHSGEVRFGDAHLSIDGERSLKVPSAWFNIKGGRLTDNNNYVQSEVPSDFLLSYFINGGKQLKQVREGYFMPESGVLCKPKRSYAIKSAHDSVLRRSKEGAMYGYESLASGSEWLFDLEIDSSVAALEGELVDSLSGVKRLGRSRTAEYGRCRIELVERKVIDLVEPSFVEPGDHFIYFSSDALFVDHHGEPTLQPDCASLGLSSEVELLWDSSQIRSRIYAPYNFKRGARDADRLVVAKGSVIKFRCKSRVDVSALKLGVGGFRSEGFGALIIDPSFLNCDDRGKLTLSLCEEVVDRVSHGEFVANTPLLAWLQAQSRNNGMQELLLTHATSFLEKYRNIFAKDVSPSQWGGVRSIASRSKSTEELEELLFRQAPEEQKHLCGYLEHGVTAQVWREKRRANVLKEFIEERSRDDQAKGALGKRYVANCVELLASTMQKSY